ncbi:hypothetical protein ACFWNT_11105 [Streptomyces sp. NPDC058409]|uniref:hypothetical protein n=1 Tax=Streptomyces sp. NPDC058409 TaxID=3346484 RepID=UPI00365B6835
MAHRLLRLDHKHVAGRWGYFTAWINSPLGWDQLLAGASVLIIPLIVLALIFALADNWASRLGPSLHPVPAIEEPR